MIKQTLHQILTTVADLSITLQQSNGSFSSGHNGPYHDPETPVRNTAHFLYLFAELYSRTGSSTYKRAGEGAIEYLTSSAARPYTKTFYHRDKAGKDRCNGLVGQAWCIEALVRAATAYDRPDCYALAEEVFLLHPWDENVTVWKRVDVDGTVLSHDGTFNHQLWFAAAAAQLVETSAAQQRAKLFLENVASRVETYPDGVIFHGSVMRCLWGCLKNGPKELVREIRSRRRKRTQREELRSKSVGYHAFNLYAYALLRSAYPRNLVWQKELVQRLLEPCESTSFNDELSDSEFGYRYNISGVELAYAVRVLRDDRSLSETWLNRQFDLTYLSSSQPLSRGTVDLHTASARIYEAARLPDDYEVSIEG